MLKKPFPVALAPLLSAFSAGCTVLPSYGPSVMDIALHKAKTTLDPACSYVMVQMDPRALDKINFFQPKAFPSTFNGTFGDARTMTIGIGDYLVVNIWEPSPDGIFATIEKKQTTLQVVVDEDGKVYIPYAGHVQAAGRKVEELRQAIEEGLKGKAVEPQVQVLLKENNASAVIVTGDVGTSGQYSVPVQGLRLMEAIARAGGSRTATYETAATITRGQCSGTVWLDEVIRVPANNIWLAPGDNVLVLHKPRTYSAFGAVKTAGLTPFKSESVSLIEALAQVGGLRDFSADAGGVFLFRFENMGLARSLLEIDQSSVNGKTPDQMPVIYRLDFQDPQAFFIAQKFRIRDKDILYVANHPTAELAKFLSTIVSPLLSVVRTAPTIVSLQHD